MRAVIPSIRHQGLRQNRRGFTIVELLVSLGLMVLLMAGLYSAMSIYTDLQMDSHEDITRAQVSRTLLRQISRDVQSVLFIPQDTTEDEDDSEDDEDTADAADVAADPSTSMGIYTNGLVGTATELMLFISRPDREMNYVSAQEITTISDRSSDTMIVRYMMADTSLGGLAAEIAERNAGGSFSGAWGLVRMTGDVYGLSTAVQEDDEFAQMAAAKVTAREVSGLEFRYYDGLVWQSEWDSTLLNLLPVAIEVTLTLRTPESTDPADPAPADNRFALGETTHRMIIPLPVADPWVEESAL